VPARTVTIGQRSQDAGRGQNAGDDPARALSPRGIAARRPLQQRRTPDRERLARRFRQREEGRVGQIVDRHEVPALRASGLKARQALRMEHAVDLAGAQSDGAPASGGEGGGERARVGAATLEAGAMPGGERGRLVEEEQLGIARAPNLAMPPLELEPAADPGARHPPPQPQRAVGAMEAPAAVAEEQPPGDIGMEIAERIDAIGKRHRGTLTASFGAGQEPQPALRATVPWIYNAGMKDARGLDVTADQADAVAAADDFATRLLRLDQGVGAILDAVKRWPQTPILQLYTAAFWLLGQTGDAIANAATHLAVSAGLKMNARERALHRALTFWHGNDNLHAVEAMEAITAQWPRDLCTAKFAEFLYYILGQQHMGPRFRAHMTRLAPQHADDADFLAMAAFAHELCGDYAAGETTAERALVVAARNPWAQHALSHVLIHQGRVQEGRARLEAFLPLLETCGRPIHCHDAWHLALLYLEELDVAAAMRVFHDHVWGITPDFVVEQLDAIALLWRIEMAGEPQGGQANAPWAAIADKVAPRALECFMPFMNAHYVYALARAGRSDAVAATLAAVRARSAAKDEEATRVWAPVGRPIVEAAAAFGAGDRARAATLLDPVMAQMTAIGGSDAQDDLFRQTYLRSLQAAGRHADAAAYFGAITGAKTRTPLDRALAN
jgi:hypothetical protein